MGAVSLFRLMEFDDSTPMSQERKKALKANLVNPKL
jgi:hypothetical protein